MPPRDIRSFLQDILDAADAIESHRSGRTNAEFRSDRMLRSAVERELMIVGEAVRHVIRIDPTLEGTISHARRIIDFRNIVVHGYHAVDPDVVWGLLDDELRLLRGEVSALLDSLGR